MRAISLSLSGIWVKNRAGGTRCQTRKSNDRWIMEPCPGCTRQQASDPQKENTGERDSPENFFGAALIVKQKSGFSLSDSHSFNRADTANPQHWQYNAILRWNFFKKASSTSLDLLRLHMAFIFVLCASVCVLVTQQSAIKSDN